MPVLVSAEDAPALFQLDTPAPPAPPDVEPGKFGTIIADPPWAYLPTSGKDLDDTPGKLRGYSDRHYDPLSTEDLCALPVGDLAADRSVLLLWTTFPFIADAQKVIAAWGFNYVTGLAWVKADPVTGNVGYGVGHWFRGAVELILVGKRRVSYRSQWVGLIHPGLKHSKKPDDLHQLAEATYPGPRLELFARYPRNGWTTLGNEVGDCLDIRDSLPVLVESVR